MAAAAARVSAVRTPANASQRIGRLLTGETSTSSWSVSRATMSPPPSAVVSAAASAASASCSWCLSISLVVHVYITLVIATFAVVERQEHSPTSVVWSETSLLSKQGDNVTLTCTVYNAGFFDVVRLTLTPRSTVALADMRPSVEFWTISDNGHMKTEFAQLGRYSIGFRSLRSTVTVQLNITGVQGEDSGTLGCHKLQSSTAPMTTNGNDQENAAYAQLKVLVPLSSLHIVAISASGIETPVDGGESVVILTQGVMDGVGCVAVVDGTATAPPEIEITIADNDETDAFKYKHTSQPIGLVLPPGGGPTHYRTVVRLDYITDEPDIEFNQKSMQCAAVQPGFQKEVASAELEVRFAPIINCTGNHLRARVGEAVTFTCILRANPSCDDVTWTYANPDHVDEDLHADSNVRIDDVELEGDLSQASMTIKHVLTGHFQSYYLTATNDVGQRRATVSLANVTDVTTPVPAREVRRNHRNMTAVKSNKKSIQHPQQHLTPVPRIGSSASTATTATSTTSKFLFWLILRNLVQLFAAVNIWTFTYGSIDC